MIDLSKVENIPLMSDSDIALGDGHRFMLEDSLVPEVDTKWNKLFSILFYGSNGKKIVFDMKDNFTEQDGDRYWRFIRSVMASYAPKHQHKERFCAYVLSEWLKGYDLVEPNDVPQGTPELR